MLKLFQRLFSRKECQPTGFDTVKIDIAKKITLHIEGMQFYVYEPSYLTELEFEAAETLDEAINIALRGCVRDSLGGKMTEEQVLAMSEEHKDVFLEALNRVMQQVRSDA